MVVQNRGGEWVSSGYVLKVELIGFPSWRVKD